MEDLASCDDDGCGKDENATAENDMLEPNG